MSRWVLALLTVCLLLPSASFQAFDGLPLSTFTEFAALLLLAPVVMGRALQRLYARRLRPVGPRACRRFAASATLALGLELILLGSGLHALATGLATSTS
jgi:hypothetical protein